MVGQSEKAEIFGGGAEASADYTAENVAHLVSILQRHHTAETGQTLMEVPPTLTLAKQVGELARASLVVGAEHMGG